MGDVFRDRVVLSSPGGELVFNERDERPYGAVKFALDVLTPWDATAELDIEFATIGAVDGEIPGDGTYGGKQYTIGGLVYAANRTEARNLWDSIGRVLARNVDIRIERTEYDEIDEFADPLARFTVGRINGIREPSWVTPWSFRWGASVRAYSPFRYAADPLQASAGVTGQVIGGLEWPIVWPLDWNAEESGIGNRIELDVLGTVDTPKVYATLYGPLPEGGWRVVNETTGEFLRINVGLGASDVLAIDFDNERSTLNGQPVTASVIGTYFRLKAGVINTLRLYSEYDPNASFTVVTYSAWE